VLNYHLDNKVSSYYCSDIPGHIKAELHAGLYTKPNLFLLDILITNSVKILTVSGMRDAFSSCNILMILILLASLYFTVIILQSYFKDRYKELNPYLIDFVSLSLVIVSMIILTPFQDNVYIGSGTPNPWHSPSNIFCRPFCLIVFIYLAKSFENYKEKKSYIWQLFMVSLFSILSMWAKPSFLISFLPTIAILFSYKLIKQYISLTYFISIGVSLLPSLVVLALINSSLYHSTNTSDVITFSFGTVWSHSSKNILLSVFLGMVFPLYISIISIRKISFSILLALGNYIIATLFYLCLTENGDRMLHGNFGWGYLFAMFFMFFATTEYFFLKKVVSGIGYKIGCFLFALHLISGLFYFLKVVAGYPYS